MLASILPHQNTLAAADSLHTLLEDEKLHGTRERDLTAPRPGHYYFKPGSKYLLVEDATGKHRTVLVKEYTYTKDGPEYPVLYDSFLRPSSSNQNGIAPEKVRARAWALYVERQSFEGEHPPGELRRATSLRTFPGTPKLPEPSPYQNASGNSVAITSNIASTSTANHSPYLIGLPAAAKDKVMAQMSKRVQVLKGNAARRNGTDFGLPNRRATTGDLSHTGFRTKTIMTQDQVVAMLQQARAPVKDAKVTYEMRWENRRRVEAGLKGRDQDTAPGYCENCRLRYTDLSVVSISACNGILSDLSSTLLRKSIADSLNAKRTSATSITSYGCYVVR
jgi:regulatory subunit for Cdc7p protein kinase